MWTSLLRLPEWPLPPSTRLMNLRPSWVVTVTWVTTVVTVVIAVILLIRNGSSSSFGRYGSAYGGRLIFAVAGVSCTLSFATVGAIIVRHRRRHPVGWLFCAAGLLLAVQALATFYATQALVSRPGSLRGGEVMAWLGSWTAAPAVLLIPLFCFVLFPDGRLPAPRWRLVAWLDGLALVMATVGVAFRPGPLVVLPSVANPLAPPGMAGRLAGGVFIAGAVLLPLALAASVGSLIARLRRARGIQRQQLRWFASAAAVVAVIAIPLLPGQFVAPSGWTSVALVALVIAIVGLPVSAAIAILRYRLYDLDVLLNRTLVYGMVTTVLGAGYAAVVLAVGAVLPGAGTRGGLGGGNASPLAVAVATLTVAAMFQPARRRVQGVVDRRFNRRRYNAQRTVEAFAARLREQTDLEALVGDLIAVVNQAMEPTQVSLWLGPSPGAHFPASGDARPIGGSAGIGGGR